jgi:hypothetical protein
MAAGISVGVAASFLMVASRDVDVEMRVWEDSNMAAPARGSQRLPFVSPPSSAAMERGDRAASRSPRRLTGKNPRAPEMLAGAAGEAGVPRRVPAIALDRMRGSLYRDFWFRFTRLPIREIRNECREDLRSRGVFVCPPFLEGPPPWWRGFTGAQASEGWGLFNGTGNG